MVSACAVVGLAVLVSLARGGARPRPARPFRQVLSTQGAARGYFAPRPPHYAFLGLPYARAPTPDKRFKSYIVNNLPRSFIVKYLGAFMTSYSADEKDIGGNKLDEAPEAPPSWDGIFEATHRVRCPQDGAGDENCLVVNVFAPDNRTRLPVLVIVHDGHFQNGRGPYLPPERLLSQGIIIVTFNYRLGILGFLCLGTPEAPGNAGLKDQVAALYWVQRNIASFGGDPADVTVYGLGSGAIAVHLLLLSGLTEGLIHKVVLESGSALSPSSINYEPEALAMTAAVNLGYEGSLDPNELVQFFRNIPAKNLSKIPEIFLPCIENNDSDYSLLDWDPIEVLKKGSFQQVPVLMMYSTQDGMSIVMKNIDKFEHIPQNFEDLLPNNLKFNDEKTKLKIGQFVKEFYFDNVNNAMEQSYVDYFHDVLYEYPVLKSAILYAEQCFFPLFVLKFGYKRMTRHLSQGDYEKIMDYVFSKQDVEGDEIVTERLITLLSNFIKLSDPTPITTSLIPVVWQPVEEDSNGRLNIRTVSILLLDNSISMSTTSTDHRMTFWDHVYENFYRTQASIHEH